LDYSDFNLDYANDSLDYPDGKLASPTIRPPLKINYKACGRLKERPNGGGQVGW
jgi:hypothetical protein